MRRSRSALLALMVAEVAFGLPIHLARETVLWCRDLPSVFRHAWGESRWP
jgi:hypothetical protein